MSRFSVPLIALGLGLQFTDPGVASLTLAASLVALVAGFVLAPKKPRPGWSAVMVAVLAGTALLAVPAAAIRGQQLPQTIILAILTVPVALLFFASDGRKVIWWLMPLVTLHAGVVYWEGFHGVLRADGLTTNPNTAAGLLMLGVVVLLIHPGRQRWLAVPLAFAIAYTGARWASMTVLIVAAPLVLRSFPPKQTAVLVGVTLLAVLMDNGGMRTAYRAEDIGGDFVARFPIYGFPPLLPVGFMDPSGGDTTAGWFLTPHNVPLRMAYETGIFSSLAWLALTAGALAQRRLRPEWWLLVPVVLLSLVYYWTWVGPLGGIWALLAGSQLSATPQTKPEPARTPVLTAQPDVVT